MSNTSQPVAAAAAAAKPARRKLQKCDPKLRKAKRGSADSSLSAHNYGMGFLSPTSRSFGESIQNVGLKSPSMRQLPDTPDLSDAKWNHYLSDDRPLTSPGLPPEPPQREPPSVPAQWESRYRECCDEKASQRVGPEFSRLTIHDPAMRPSLDSSSIPSPASSTSTSSMMRRQAKTPVFQIGQPETPRFGRELEPPEKTSSVDLIADQYKALLETRDGSDMESINDESRRPSYDNLDVPRSHPRRRSADSMRSTTHLQPPPTTYNTATYTPRWSPPHTTSADDAALEAGLVAFQEDAIYFKPVSFDPEPAEQATAHTSANDNLSLQICLDLLTRELSSAFAGPPHRKGSDTSALQIWVMIEAYERLRGQVSAMARHNPEMKRVNLVFESWLRALYAIHTSMMGAVPSESEYSTLEEDLD